MDSELDDRNFVINVLRKEPEVQGDIHQQSIKLQLFETVTGTSDSYIFSDKEVFSAEQLEEIAKPSCKDCTHLLTKAVDSRLRVKEIENQWIGLQTKQFKFMVFFMNPVLFE